MSLTFVWGIHRWPLNSGDIQVNTTSGKVGTECRQDGVVPVQPVGPMPLNRLPRYPHMAPSAVVDVESDTDACGRRRVRRRPRSPYSRRSRDVTHPPVHPQLSDDIKSSSYRRAWASYHIRKIAACACTGNAGDVFSATDFKGNRYIVSDPDMHHGTCVTHVPWHMSGSLTRGGGQNAPDIPGTCATRNFTYLVRGPLERHFIAKRVYEDLSFTTSR